MSGNRNPHTNTLPEEKLTIPEEQTEALVNFEMLYSPIPASLNKYIDFRKKVNNLIGIEEKKIQDEWKEEYHPVFEKDIKEINSNENIEKLKQEIEYLNESKKQFCAQISKLEKDISDAKNNPEKLILIRKKLEDTKQFLTTIEEKAKHYQEKKEELLKRYTQDPIDDVKKELSEILFESNDDEEAEAIATEIKVEAEKFLMQPEIKSDKEEEMSLNLFYDEKEREQKEEKRKQIFSLGLGLRRFYDDKTGFCLNVFESFKTSVGNQTEHFPLVSELHDKLKEMHEQNKRLILQCALDANTGKLIQNLDTAWNDYITVVKQPQAISELQKKALRKKLASAGNALFEAFSDCQIQYLTPYTDDTLEASIMASWERQGNKQQEITLSALNNAAESLREQADLIEKTYAADHEREKANINALEKRLAKAEEKANFPHVDRINQVEIMLRSKIAVEKTLEASVNLLADSQFISKNKVASFLEILAKKANEITERERKFMLSNEAASFKKFNPELLRHYDKMEARLRLTESEAEKLLSTERKQNRKKLELNSEKYKKVLDELNNQSKEKKSTHLNDIKQFDAFTKGLTQAVEQQYSKYKHELSETHNALMSEIKELKFSETQTALNAVGPLSLSSSHAFNLFYQAEFIKKSAYFEELALHALTNPSPQNKNALNFAKIKLNALHTQLINKAKETKLTDEKEKKQLAKDISQLEETWDMYLNELTSLSKQPKDAKSRESQKKQQELKITVLLGTIEAFAKGIAEKFPRINIEEQKKQIIQQQENIRSEMLKTLQKSYDEKIAKLEKNKSHFIASIKSKQTKFQKKLEDQQKRKETLLRKIKTFDQARLSFISELNDMANAIKKQAKLEKAANTSEKGKAKQVAAEAKKFAEKIKGQSLNFFGGIARKAGAGKAVEKFNLYRGEDNLKDTLLLVIRGSANPQQGAKGLNNLNLKNLSPEMKEIIKPFLTNVFELLKEHAPKNPKVKEIEECIIALSHELYDNSPSPNSKQSREEKRNPAQEDDDYVIIPDEKQKPNPPGRPSI